jgi:hypothetical protein
MLTLLDEYAWRHQNDKDRRNASISLNGLQATLSRRGAFSCVRVREGREMHLAVARPQERALSALQCAVNCVGKATKLTRPALRLPSNSIILPADSLAHPAPCPTRRLAASNGRLCVC